MENIVIFHGSEKVVLPVFGEGKAYNDYGLGFYCTENLELAKEWACSHGTDGLYVLDIIREKIKNGDSRI